MIMSIAIIKGLTSSGNAVPIAVSPEGLLQTEGGSGGGGDATAANQQSEITNLQAISSAADSIYNLLFGSLFETIPGNQSLIDASGTLATQSQLALAENTYRRYLLLQNLSETSVLWINFGAIATNGSSSIALDPRQSLTMEGSMVARDSVHLFGEIGTPYTLKHMNLIAPHRND